MKIRERFPTAAAMRTGEKIVSMIFWVFVTFMR